MPYTPPDRATRDPRRVTLALLSLLIVAACSQDRTGPSAPMSAAPAAPGGEAAVVPPHSSAFGKSAGEWAAAWWQWALQIPTGDNPLIDPTGDHCAVGQTGQVWFLAGTLGSDPVTRHCRVPRGWALLFPLINLAYFAFLSDPPETRTEEFVRSQVTCIEDAEFGLVEVDGVAVAGAGRYFEKSVLFDVILPEDNLFDATEDDIPELTLSPSVDAGYYLRLPPLAPGGHTLRWRASSAGCGFGQEVTYELTVG